MFLLLGYGISNQSISRYFDYLKINYIIYDDNGLYGILDKDGKELIKPQYKQFPTL